MRHSLFWVAFIVVSSAQAVRAGHIFNEGANPDPPVSLLPQQGVEVTLKQTFDDSATGFFALTLRFNFDFSGLAEDDWSSGDILRFTMNGFSLLFDFDNPLANTTTNVGFSLAHEIATGDAGFTEYDDQVVVDNTFTLELLSGDGVRFDGFTLADGIGGTNKLNSAAFADHGNVFAVPEPCTIVLLGFGLLSPICVRRQNGRQAMA